MSFDLDSLLRLGDLDSQLIRLRKRLESAPQLAAPQRQRVEAAEAELAKLKDESKLGQREVTRLEGEAVAKKSEVEKNQVLLNQAKTNEEYQTLLRTIETKQGELSEIETGILEEYEAQDERASREKSSKERLTQQNKELVAAKGRVKTEEEARRGEIVALETERGEVTVKLDPPLLELYEKVLTKKGDSATAEVVEEMCQGCYMKVRPEQISDIRGRKEIVTCFQCGRLLWGRFGE